MTDLYLDPNARRFLLLRVDPDLYPPAAPRPAVIDVEKIALAARGARAREIAAAALAAVFFAAPVFAVAPRPAYGIEGKTPRKGNARANQGCEGQIRTRFARLRSEGAGAIKGAKGQKNALLGRGAAGRNVEKSFNFNM